MYLIFSNIEDFDSWHEEKKSLLGLPNGITKNITLPEYHPSGDVVCAFVDKGLGIDGDYFTTEQVQASGFLQL